MSDYKKTKDTPDIIWQPLYWIDNESFNQRRIVSAANRYKLNNGEDLVIPCVRHYSKEHALILDQLSDKIVNRQVVETNQGFIDQYSNYWRREEAMIIATHAGQVRAQRGGPDTMLFSEDLY